MTTIKDVPITCYIGLTVVRMEVLTRVNAYKKKVDGLLGRIKSPLNEAHITLVPPFHTDYKTASQINLGCALSTLCSTSIVNDTVFCIGGLEVMHFEGDDIIHFPIWVKNGKEGATEIFKNKVTSLRQKIKGLGGELRQPIPEEYTPHISVCTSWRGKDQKLRMILTESKHEPVISFRATYPSLYAKYKGLGYQDLTYNPNDRP